MPYRLLQPVSASSTNMVTLHLSKATPLAISQWGATLSLQTRHGVYYSIARLRSYCDVTLTVAPNNTCAMSLKPSLPCADGARQTPLLPHVAVKSMNTKMAQSHHSTISSGIHAGMTLSLAKLPIAVYAILSSCHKTSLYLEGTRSCSTAYMFQHDP
jgi:hypothetical protein